METTRFLNGVSIILVYSAMAFLAIEATNITTDQSSLLALKAHITHDPLNFLANNWTASTSVCNWVGITCDSQNNRVIGLNLTSMSRTGTIPSHIGNLSFLVQLRLRNNSFQGSLPVDLVHLHRLEILHLGYNSFQGEIPSWLGSLPKLQILYLFRNNFTGTIPPSLGNITTLKNLELWNNSNLNNLETFNLYGNQQISGTIPPTIFNISSLDTIDFALNGLSGNLPDDMCQYLPVLKRLILHHNQLEGSIPSSLGQCKELLRISLDGNKFTGIIPRNIGNLSLLQELYLDTNDLKDLASNLFSGPIPTALGHLRNLQQLSLCNNNLTGLIPSTIFNISKLESILLYMNRLSGPLPSTIGLGLPNLKELLLWDNELNGIIPGSISNASELTILELASNSFSGPIPTTLGHLRNLQRLNLASNQLTRESSTQELTFLSSLTNCKFFTRLVLNNNPLNGTLPISIGNLSALESFLVDCCKIKGSIPYEVVGLSNLTTLRLTNNDLTGLIPTAVGKMRKLQVLSFEGNRLQGFIPIEVCHLRNLGELYLGGNKLFGPIPACLGDVTSLRVLYLNSNNLTSTIPSSLWSLKDILDLNLSTNSLRGHLSLDIEKLKVVTQIDLSGNELSRDIPSSIGGLQNLMKFSLARNKLRGPIPESFGNLISLEFLDLSSNNLSGAIPKSLDKLRYFKELNLSFNRLEGEIPTEGPFTNFSTGSFMGNNELCGASRLQVPQCKTRALQESKKKKTSVMKPIYILPTIASMILVLAFTYFLLRSRKRKSKSLEEDVLTLATWRRISYQEIQNATNGFEESNLLGKFLDGMIIAVKVFNLQVDRASKSFDDECEVMSKIRHRNLVKIISSCSNIDFKALVLEYMPNRSLETWLYSHNYCLDTLQRLNIMIDVASALEYLHHDYATPIVHCDLKPSNVLLDKDMVAHVGDFGIAKLLGEGDSMRQTNTLATIGYMAPEYGSEGIVSVTGDVYSFGVLMMETFTRKKPADNMFEGGISLKWWVKEALPNSVTEIVDANLLGEENLSAKVDCISSTLQLAVSCCEELSERKLDITNVLGKLPNIRKKFENSVVLP
ncbi:hypothetical protein ACOSP7_011802 [Xanthoceras sorbifolium]